MLSMRKPLIAFVVLASGGGALTTSLATAAPSQRTVKVGDNWFLKNSGGTPKITVSRNTTVRFVFVGDSVHDVVGYRGSAKKFESSIKSSGSYRKKLTTSGTYKLVCSIHGAADQSMRIVVK